MSATDVHSAPLDVFFRGVRHAEQRKQPSSASTCNNSPCRQRESGCQSFGSGVSKQAAGRIPLALLLLGIVIPVQSPSVNSLALASCSRMNLHNPSLYD
ncbi:unnamed protein product [Sphagnum troendelagicum]|uniref:Uncharacterized protein n=1 Tax=Sphagnum troendelagicum TaxID=128251 RepID=A0ABP0UBD9_9BRYO